MGGCKEDGTRLLAVPSTRIRGSGHKLKHSKFHLSIKNTTFFAVKVLEQALPGEVVEPLSLEVFKT